MQGRFFQFLIEKRYSEGVIPVTFLNVVQKLLSLVKPVLKQMSLMEMSRDFKRNLALLTLAAITYSCGENPDSFLNSRLK